MLQLQGVAVRISGRTVLEDVSLQVERERVVGLLGPNGAGKTTCFRAILGSLPCVAGEILLDGEDLVELPVHRRARKGIGYLPQEPSIFRGLDVKHNILGVLELRRDLDSGGRREILERLLGELQIGHLRRRKGLSLSGGERRRVEIARALAAGPSYMLLDEPLAGVDPISMKEIQQLVRHLTDRGVGVLVTDHNVRETLGLCDHAYILNSGKVLAQGLPGEIVEDPGVRGVYLGDDFRL